MGNACNTDCVAELDVRPKIQRKGTRVQKNAGASSLRPPGTKPSLDAGQPGRWEFTEQADKRIALTTTNKAEPIIVDTKDEAIQMVKNDPVKYFGCEWLNKGWGNGKAKVFPRSCEFYRDGIGQGRQGAQGAMKAVYKALATDYKMDPDKYTDYTLSKYQGVAYNLKCPGRKHGLADVPGLRVFKNIDPHDVRQGAIADNWLLTAIGSMAEFPKAIEKLFEKTPSIHTLPADRFNKYTVTLYDMKSWKPVDVVVDERLPWSDDRGNALGAPPTECGELWPCILEKAVAAHCGGWDKLTGGTCVHAWRLLTGCKEVYNLREKEPGHFRAYSTYNPNEDRYEEMGNSPQDGFQGLWPSRWPEVGGGGGLRDSIHSEDVFARMCLWDDSNFPMCCATRAGGDGKNDSMVDGQAFTILKILNSCASTDFDMVQLRGPKGSSGLDLGEWALGSTAWDRYEKVFEACDQPRPNEGGIFWVEKKDFFKLFKTIYLCTKAMA